MLFNNPNKYIDGVFCTYQIYWMTENRTNKYLNIIKRHFTKQISEILRFCIIDRKHFNKCNVCVNTCDRVWRGLKTDPKNFGFGLNPLETQFIY